MQQISKETKQNSTKIYILYNTSISYILYYPIMIIQNGILIQSERGDEV